ncbi:MAG: LCP family protein [Bacillota bacterium]
MDFSSFDQYSYDEMSRVHKLQVRQKRKFRFFTKLLVLLLVFAAAAYAGFMYADDLWSFVAQKWFAERIRYNPKVAGATAMDDANPRLNVMILGVDQRKHEPARSDTLMVAVIDLKNRLIHVISIPRDTRIKIAGLEHKTKINHAYPNGGVELTRSTVEDLLGIPVHNYVETNFKGFKNIIDVLGGVEIDVEKRMKKLSEDINLKKGPQRLDGYNALAYVRYRDDAGDLGRMERQQKFLQALADQTMRLETLVKAPKIIGELKDNVDTDLSMQDILILGSTLKKVDSSNLIFHQLPGAADYRYGASYYFVDEEKLSELMKEINGDVETPGYANSNRQKGINL